MQSKFVKFLVVLAVVAIIANTIWNLVSAYMERAAARRAVAQADLADDPIGGSAGTGDGVMGEFSDSILIGEPWQWRVVVDELVSPNEPTPYDFDTVVDVDIWNGDTDGDGQDELLVLKEDSPLEIHSLDGQVLTTEVVVGYVEWPYYCWDADHDGCDEITMGASSLVWDLDGQCVLRLADDLGAWHYNFLDMDSDGFSELIVNGSSDDDFDWQTIIYGQDGAIVWEAEPGKGFGDAVGDFDADGRVESIRRQTEHSGPPDYIKTYQLELVDLDGNVTLFEDWPPEMDLLACSDLDGDGADELINGWYGYLNMVTGELMRFALPDGVSIPEQPQRGKTLIADLDGDGEPEIIHCCAPADLLVFKLSGECVYFEKFFLTLDVEVLHSPEQDYVVAMTNDKILIYP